MSNRRVVVTGMGIMSCIGKDIDTFWKNIKAGECGAGPITLFDAKDHKTKIAGEVKDFDPSEYMDKKEARKMARFTQFAVAASTEALKDAKLTVDDDFNRERFGVILGNGIGGFEIIEDSMFRMFERGPNGIPPMSIPKIITNEGPGNVAIVHKIHGPVLTISTACSSATDALGFAFNTIKSGMIDGCISGGMEAAVTGFSIGAFNKLQALSTNFNDNPKVASRPFDKDRDGFVMGEGAGILVLEELEHAKARGAHIYAEMVGYGGTCDANHLTAPDPEGDGAARAMKTAMADANMKPEDIDYINAHGTSTPVNDPTETKAIKTAFGEYANEVKISSTKAMTCHMVGGAGGVESIIGIKAMNDSYIPGTMNLEEAGEGCDLNYVPNKGVDQEVNAFLSETLGFGGHNSAVIFKKYK